MARPTALDLFAGAGGLSLGLEAAGFDIAGATDIDPIHCATHEYNFPYSAIICGDLSELSSDNIIDKISEKGFNRVDLIAGGPPCQGFSQIGYRQLNDPRNRLVFEFVRVVTDLKPKYFLFENVPGILAGKHAVFVKELMQAFRSAGYDMPDVPRVINAASFGVAQNRRRFILIGNRNDVTPVTYPKETHHDNRNDNQNDNSLFPFDKYFGVASVISDLEKIPVFIGEDPGVPPERIHYTSHSFPYNLKRSDEFALCYKRSVTRVFNHTGARHTKKSIERFMATKPGEVEQISRFYKTHPKLPCNTLRAGTDSKRGAYTAPRPIHYLLPRCISVREGGRIHSFPDWFRFHMTIWHGFRQIGNSVAPLFAKRLGEAIRTAIGSEGEIPSRELAGDEKYLALQMNEACDLFGVKRGIVGRRDKINKRKLP